MNYLTTEQVAEQLGISIRRVQAMVKAGRLPAERFGRALMIREGDLYLVADRKPGRPAKEQEFAPTPKKSLGRKEAKKASENGQ